MILGVMRKMEDALGKIGMFQDRLLGDEILVAALRTLDHDCMAAVAAYNVTQLTRTTDIVVLIVRNAVDHLGESTL